MSRSLKGFLVVFLLPALLIALNYDMIIPGDVAWYLSAAPRMLAGEALTLGWYDTNPPMSTIIYIPAVLLSYAGVPIWLAGMIYSYALVFLCVWLTLRLLQTRLKPEHAYVAVVAYIAMIFVNVHSLGMKDFFIALTLVPMLLAQQALTEKHSVSPWIVRAAILIAVPFILVKPHYGLLPVVLLAWRFYKQRRFSIVCDFDFAALAAGVVLYVTAVIFLFPDFISEALPISLGAYVDMSYGNLWPVSLGFLLLFGSLAVIGASMNASAVVFFSVMAALAVIPFLVQQKGFFLHMLPVLFLGGIALSLAAAPALEKLAKEEWGARAICGFLVILAVASSFFYKDLSRRDFVNSELHQFIIQNADDSSFFIESPLSNHNFVPSVYSGINAATRFPSMWPVSGIIELEESDPQRQKLIDYFGPMIAADLARYKPAFIALYAADNKETGYDLQRLSIARIFKDEAAVRKELAHYQKRGTLKAAAHLQDPVSSGMTAFEEKTVTYDVYYRTGD